MLRRWAQTAAAGSGGFSGGHGQPDEHAADEEKLRGIRYIL
jgi:hypothetical protein